MSTELQQENERLKDQLKEQQAHGEIIWQDRARLQLLHAEELQRRTKDRESLENQIIKLQSLNTKPKVINIEVYKFDTYPAFDAIELHPCHTIKVGREEEDVVEVCEPEEAEFYSVYLHCVGGGLQCIADCESKEQAENLYHLLTCLISLRS